MSFGSDLDQATTNLSEIGNRTVTDIKTAFGGLSDTLGNPDQILDAVSNGLSNIKTEINTAFDNSIKNIKDLGNDLKSIFSDSPNKETIEDTPPFSNILHNYTTYNYIFTLSVMDDYMLNFPNETYKKGELGQIILKSGSGDPGNRVEIPGYGAFEFFIEDVDIKTVIGLEKSSGNTNVTTLAFKIIEPYSMGMFFHALQQSAKDAGFENYILAPYLLTLEFMGHVNATDQGIAGDALSIIEKTTRHFPIHFNELDMNVNASGAVYDITARPANETGMSKTYTEVKTDVSISGKTVHEMLQTGTQSLQRVLNDRLQEEANRMGKVRDQILISFPSDSSTGDSAAKEQLGSGGAEKTATVNPNQSNSVGRSLEEKLRISLKESANGTYVENVEQMNPIGKASMNFNAYLNGSQPFAKDNFVYDEKKHVYARGNLSVDPNIGNMKFSQGDNICNIINQVILMSDYSRQALLAENKTKSGKIIWWRIEPQLYSIPTDLNYKVTGSKPKLINYRVMPYAVDASVFLPPTKANPSVEEAKKQCIKEYNYIYTSENVDILDLELKFKAGFYQAMQATNPKYSGDVAQQEKQGTVSSKPKQEEDNPDIASRVYDTKELKDREGEVMTEQRTDQTSSSTSKSGGSSLNNTETLLAKQAHDIIMNGVDMLKPTLRILGDPYYLADSGMGNYSSKQTNYENMNADHSIDYQSGEVDVILNFRTPLDIDMASGTYNFGPTKLMSQFSGLYKLLMCDSNFSHGKFTQSLTLARRTGQNAKKE